MSSMRLPGVSWSSRGQLFRAAVLAAVACVVFGAGAATAGSSGDKIIFATNTQVYAKDLDTGVTAWTYTFSPSLDRADVATLKNGQGGYYVLVRTGLSGVYGLLLLDAVDGSEIWTRANVWAPLIWGPNNNVGLNRRGNHPAYEDPIYFPDGPPGASDGTYLLVSPVDKLSVEVVRAYDGTTVWTNPIPSAWHNLGWIPDVNGDTAYDIVVASQSGSTVTCLDGVSGGQLWVQTVTDAAGGIPVPDVNDDGVFDYAHGRIWNSTIYMRSGVDGSQIWSYTASAQDGTADVVFPKPDGSCDVVCSFQGGVPHRLTGAAPVSLVWTASGGPGSDSAYMAARLLGTPTSYNVMCHWRSNNKVSALDGSTGAVLWTKNISGDNVYVTLPDRNSDGYEDVLLFTGGTVTIYDGLNGATLESLSDTGVTNVAFLPASGQITVTAPNGGETWYVNNTYDITWTSSGLSMVDIYYSTDSGATWMMITGSIPDTGSYMWTVPADVSAQCRIRVEEPGTASDISNSDFTIAGTIIVNFPNGGEIWDVGSNQMIDWSWNGVTDVRIELSRDGGATWEPIIDMVPADMTPYSWTVTASGSTVCLVRVSDYWNPAIAWDDSDMLFEIFDMGGGGDLRVLSVMPSNSNPSTTETISVDVIVANAGSVDVGPFDVGLFYNWAAQPQVWDPADMYQSVPSLPAGLQTTVTFTNITNPMPETWSMWAAVDTGLMVSEMDETNNVSVPPEMVNWGGAVNWTVRAIDMGDPVADGYLVDIWVNGSLYMSDLYVGNMDYSVPVAPGDLVEAWLWSQGAAYYELELYDETWMLVDSSYLDPSLEPDYVSGTYGAGQPPYADAGGDIWVTDMDGDGWEWVGLDGGMSYDPDGWITMWEWFEGATLIASGEWPNINFSLGTHWIELRVTDNDGMTASTWMTVDIQSGGPSMPDLEAHGTRLAGGQTAVVRTGSPLGLTLEADFAEVGGLDVTSSFEVTAFLSGDNWIDQVSDVPLGSVTVNGLGARNSQTVTLGVTVPASTPPGTYYVGCVVDSGNMVNEGNEGNNSDQSGGVVRVDILPEALSPSDYDLMVVDAWVPGEIVAGSEFQCEVRIQSLGADYGQPFSVHVVFSADSVIDLADTSVGSVSGLYVSDLDDRMQILCLTTDFGAGTSWYFGVIVDYDDTWPEGVYESNNVYYGGMVTVTGPASAWLDLRAEGSYGPPVISMALDTPYNLEYGFGLDGNASAGPFFVRFYISRDDTIGNADDIEVGWVSFGSFPVGWLDGGDNWATLTVPVDTPLGPYYLGFIVDADGEVSEIDDETNNVSGAMGPFQVIDAAGAKADLLVILQDPDAAMGAAAPSYFVERGRNITWPTALVANLGSAGAPADVPVKFYLSTDQTIGNADDIEVATYLRDALDAGMYYDVDDPAVLEIADFPAGTYYLYAYIDPADTVPEIDEGNNDSATLVLEIDGQQQQLGAWIELVIVDTPPGPELAASVQVDPSGYGVESWGAHFWCRATVTNASLAPGADAGATACTVWISTDPSATIQPWDTYLGAATVGFLAPGESSMFDYSQQIPFMPDFGMDYYVKVQVDCFDEVGEMDETNNVAVSVAFRFYDATVVPITFTDIGAGLMPMDCCGLAWGDYDNDGDLDLAVNGDTGSGYATKIYCNDGGDMFREIGAGVEGGRIGSLAWGDYDSDGDLDLAISGLSNSGVKISKIYRNEGGDIFADISAGLVGVYASSMAWGDYDNDGDLDLALAGEDDTGTPVCKLYRNDGVGFTDSGVVLGGVSYCTVAWGDYDNDGDLDLVVAGTDARIYDNNGDGTLTDSGTSLPMDGYGAAAWGDYDNDGDLDLAVSSRIYRNESGSFVDIQAGLPGVYASGLAWGDYDGDGDLDLVFSGSGVGSYAKVYRNDDGTFADVDFGLVSVRDCSLAWGDYDNDGDLDLALSGMDEATMAKHTRIYRRDGGNINSPPWSPDRLVAASSPGASGGDITFSWGTGGDDWTPQEGLTYNLRVGTGPGLDDVMGPMADQWSGWRRVPAMGNVQHNNSWTLKGLPDGIYHFSVQAIDSGFAGSGWSVERQIAVGPAPDLEITSVTPVPTDPNVSETISVDVTVQNNGTADAGRFSVALFYDRGPEGPSPDEPGDQEQTVMTGLVADGTTTVTFTGILHQGGSVWNVYATADYMNQVTETDESNNVYGPTTVTWHGPDLIIEQLTSSDPSPFAGDVVSVDVTIRNQGNGDAGAFSVGLFEDHPGWPGPGEQPDQTLAVTSLAAGDTTMVTFSNVTTRTVGGRSVYAVVDSAMQVPETDEWNNTAEVWIDWQRPFAFAVSSSFTAFQARSGEVGVLTKTVTVSHRSTVGSTVNISITAELAPDVHYITLTPTSFTLPVGGSRTVYVQMDPSVVDATKSMSLQSVGRFRVTDTASGDELEVDVRVGLEPGTAEYGLDFGVALGCLPARRGPGARALVLVTCIALAALRRRPSIHSGRRRRELVERRRREQRA